MRKGQKPGTWEIRVAIGRDPLTGKYRQLSRVVVGGRRDAENAMAELISSVAFDGKSSPSTAVTVSDLLAQWLDHVQDRLSPTTVRNYRGCCRRYLDAGIGRKQVRKVTTRDVDVLYQALARKRGLSPRSIRQVHAILRGAFAQAVRWEWVRTNPVATASPPTVHKADIHPPSTEVAVALIAAADDQDPDFGVFLRLAAATGARRGELCALRWSDIDGASNTMLLARNVIAGDNGGWIEKDTKTHQSRRISLDPATMALLERQRAAGNEVASAAGVARPADAFVFSLAADGAAPWLPNHQTHRFRALCRRTGVDGVRLHDFRHMHASQLLGANIGVRTVAGRLGHANAATTLGVYAQFLQARDRDAAQVIGGLLDR